MFFRKFAPGKKETSRWLTNFFHSSTYFFFFSSRRRHTRFDCDWSSDVCSSDLVALKIAAASAEGQVAVLRKLIKSSGVYALSSVALPLIALVLSPFLTHNLSP